MTMSTYSQYIHLSRYARYLPELKRRETWRETVERYFKFFQKHIQENYNYDITESIPELSKAVIDLEVMPSMRCLMTAGKALEKENLAGYNCSYVPIDKAKSFDEVLYILLNGTGVGFSVERQYIAKLPELPEELYPSETTIMVHDSKKGWAKSLRELINLLYSGVIPSWDTTKVRPAGAPLKTFGGRASGPEPLEDLFKFVIGIFKNAVENQSRRLSSLECHDIVCKVAESVVVGGVRRSALISLSNLSDDRMRTAKMGDWSKEQSQRALANNSACYTEKPGTEIFMKEWMSLYQSKSGERGIFNREACQALVEKLGERRNPDFDFGTNPCCLVGETTIITDNGDVSIEEIIEKGIENYKVISYNLEKEKLEWVDIEAGDLTRPDTDIIELELNNGTIIQLTPDHPVYTENRGYVEAAKLDENDIILTIEKT